MRLALLLLAFFQTTPTPPATVNVYFLGRNQVCTWTPATVPARGDYTFTLNDAGATIPALGRIDPLPRGGVQASVWYQPRTSACPTIEGNPVSR